MPYLAQWVLPKPVVAGSRWTLVGSVCADFLLVLANLVVVSQVHLAIGRNLRWLGHIPAIPPIHLGFVLLYGSLITLLAYSEGLYRNNPGPDPWVNQSALARTVGWATVLSATLIHLFGIKTVIPLAPVVVFAITNFASMVAWRRWQLRRAGSRARSGHASRNVLIIGAGSLGHQVAAHLEQNPHLGRVVRGYLDDNPGLDPNVLGSVSDLAVIARAEFADEVILAAPHEAVLARKAIQEARRIHVDVKLVPELFGFQPRSSVPETIGELPVLTLHEERIPSVGLFLKRWIDVLASALGLLFVFPVLLLIGFLIRMDSPGPILYRGPRAGRKGRCFLCYKFRTMVSDADAVKERLRAQNQREGPFFKIADDPRITRVGRWLRRFSLDELPQLWNVVKGDMSLVGPRPHPLDDFSRYDLDHLRRLDVTPGLTGLWQVTARQDASFARSLTLDQQYIERWSLRLDMQILFKTLSAVLRGSGT